MYRAAVEKQTESYGHGEMGGEGEMYGKSNLHFSYNMETHITMCKTDSRWKFAVCLKELKQGLCINLEGWDGWEMGGRFKREGTYVYLMADSCWGLTENSKIL